VRLEPGAVAGRQRPLGPLDLGGGDRQHVDPEDLDPIARGARDRAPGEAAGRLAERAERRRPVDPPAAHDVVERPIGQPRRRAVAQRDDAQGDRQQHRGGGRPDDPARRPRARPRPHRQDARTRGGHARPRPQPREQLVELGRRGGRLEEAARQLELGRAGGAAGGVRLDGTALARFELAGRGGGQSRRGGAAVAGAQRPVELGDRESRPAGNARDLVHRSAPSKRRRSLRFALTM